MAIKLALTMRVDMKSGEDWVSHEWDTFLERWFPDVSWLKIPNLGANLPDGYLAEHGITGLILTGGNDIGEARERDETEAKLLQLARESQVPVLGVCRGAEFIVHSLGGRLQRCQGHAGTRHTVHFPSGTREVNSFHDWGIPAEHFPVELEVLAKDDDGWIEAFRHKTLPWHGLMWHPEREKDSHPDDLSLIRNLFRLKREAVL